MHNHTHTHTQLSHFFFSVKFSQLILPNSGGLFGKSEVGIVRKEKVPEISIQLEILCDLVEPINFHSYHKLL